MKLRDSQGYEINTVTKPLKSEGSVCERDQNQWEGRTETLVLTVRKEIGENIALLVDSSSCYTPRKLIQVGQTPKSAILKNLALIRSWSGRRSGRCSKSGCRWWQVRLPVWQRMVNIDTVGVVQPDICYKK